MNDTFVVLQLSDPHVGASWAGNHSIADLTACVEAAMKLPDPVDAVLLTGDVADHATDDEYRLVKRLIGRIDAPLYVLPGNHDVRGAMRRHFDIPGDAHAPIQYGVDVGPFGLVLLDSTCPGSAGGELPRERLDWLESALADRFDRPTLVAMYHPRFGLGALRGIGSDYRRSMLPRSPRS